MRKNIALLLGLTLGFTAISCSLPFSRAAAAEEISKVTMYRLYNPNSGEHFYTCNEGEKTNLVNFGWKDEGIGWIAPTTSDSPVYRLYNGNSGDHHYTLDEKEKNILIGAGWKYEGIGWYSDDKKTVSLYREYNPNAVTGTHNYTADKGEHNDLVKAGWKDEGIGWYAMEKKPLGIGDTVIFGAYEQDNNITNGKEEIEWKVLAKEGDKALLISKYALDYQNYNNSLSAVTWETSYLRKWLNGEFISNAFSNTEKNMIQTTTVTADMNPSYDTPPGNDTIDKVFLLSIPEANNYFSSDEARKCAPTEYTKAQEVQLFEDLLDYGYSEDSNATCCWWLRSPGSTSVKVAEVLVDGSVDSKGYYCGVGFVRPALWINQLSNLQYREVTEKNSSEFKDASVGDVVKFGAYEQDNNSFNGKEEIEWVVLAKEGDKALVISKYALDGQPYNTLWTDVTWETCSLRQWLNETFISKAFSSGEQNMIQTTTVTADKNPEYDTSPGNNTTDKVFLLSIPEVNKYFDSDEARMCAPTDYGRAQGAYRIDDYLVDGKAACCWSLRSPGSRSDYATYVRYEGAVQGSGMGVFNGSLGVRPAMWISLGS